MEKTNDDETILAELRRISAWADMQRRITKWSFIFIAALIPAMIVFGIVMEKRFATSVENVSSHEKPDRPAWSDVDWNIRHGDLDEAIKIGEELILRTPHYPDGHQRLASAYLVAGKIE